MRTPIQEPVNNYATPMIKTTASVRLTTSYQHEKPTTNVYDERARNKGDIHGLRMDPFTCSLRSRTRPRIIFFLMHRTITMRPSGHDDDDVPSAQLYRHDATWFVRLWQADTTRMTHSLLTSSNFSNNMYEKIYIFL